MMVNCSIGIAAHNEEANIGTLLQILADQRLERVNPREIVVVASGCTDQTESIVRAAATRDARVRLLVQEQREGKAAAINLYLQECREEVLVLCSADLRPAPDTLEMLVAPFADPEVGMTASRPVPVNDPGTFMGYAAHLVWNLHHAINVAGGFKAGELIAFRKVFTRIPWRTAVDEASIEPVIRAQGYGLRYVPEAIVYNKGAETVTDYLRQRRRIHAGHLALKATAGYAVSTMSGRAILRALLGQQIWRPRPLAWTAAVILLEIAARALGRRDFRRRRDHSVWEMATTTKELAPRHGP